MAKLLLIAKLLMTIREKFTAVPKGNALACIEARLHEYRCHQWFTKAWQLLAMMGNIVPGEHQSWQ